MMHSCRLCTAAGDAQLEFWFLISSFFKVARTIVVMISCPSLCEEPAAFLVSSFKFLVFSFQFLVFDFHILVFSLLKLSGSLL